MAPMRHLGTRGGKVGVMNLNRDVLRSRGSGPKRERPSHQGASAGGGGHFFSSAGSGSATLPTVAPIRHLCTCGKANHTSRKSTLAPFEGAFVRGLTEICASPSSCLQEEEGQGAGAHISSAMCVCV